MLKNALKTLSVDSDGKQRQIAFEQSGLDKETTKPGLFWLNGFRSNMTSSKAQKVKAWAQQNNIATTLFDYSGHGQSSGDFKDGTIGQWREESLQLFNQHTTGDQILVGSSMGGWMALLLLRSHLKSLKPEEKSRIKGIALIAPAFNMTRDLMWMRMDDDIRAIIQKDGFWMKPSEFGDEDFPITKELIRDGEYHLIQEVFKPHCPVRIIQGMADQVVPWRHTMKLMRHLDEDDMSYNLIKDAGHRLNRPEDVKRLIQLIEEMV